MEAVLYFEFKHTINLIAMKKMIEAVKNGVVNWLGSEAVRLPW